MAGTCSCHIYLIRSYKEDVCGFFDIVLLHSHILYVWIIVHNFASLHCKN